MGKRGGAPQVVQQAANPWGPQIPHIGQIYATAQNLAYGQPPSTFFANPTVAGFSNLQQQAMGRGEARALGGFAPLNKTIDFTNKILNNDPATINGLLGPRIEELLPELRNRFGHGAMRGSAYQLAEQKLIGQELNRLREDAMNRAERLRDVEYGDIAKLASIGEAQRELEQAKIDEQIRRHEYAQQEPWERLRNYQGAVLGHFNPTDQTQQNFAMPGSRLSGALGGALGGASAGAPYGPWGAGIGGLGGMLAGLFG